MNAIATKKSCSKCRLLKPLEQFQTRPTGKPASWCNACHVNYKREYTAKNRDKVSRYWFVSNLKKYGLTVEQYETMLAGQKGRCAICRKTLKTPCVDHCHATGKVRGLLCKHCNNVLGNARDSIETLQRAIQYLRNVED